jgi:hypothetical protein
MPSDQANAAGGSDDLRGRPAEAVCKFSPRLGDNLFELGGRFHGASLFLGKRLCALKWWQLAPRGGRDDAARLCRLLRGE